MLTLPEGYQYEVVTRWGDPLFKTAPEFNPLQQTAQSQSQQFGFNNDYVAYLPLHETRNRSEHGLLVVNHEYTKGRLMHSGLNEDRDMDAVQTEVDITAHGLSVLEVKKQQGNWLQVKDSPYTRRITPFTKMAFRGPARGHPRLKSLSGEDGKSTYGTYGNCAGGLTPWGTVLSAEENIDKYFTGDIDALPEAENYRRMDYKGKARKSWSKFHSRWDLDKHPAEGLHVGWIVEIDPFDPNSVPVKHTAMGRFKHEACTIHVTEQGRVVAYSGDDEAFEYVYRFVSDGQFNPANTPDAKKQNMHLMDNGTLSVARFDESGVVRWLPLVYGTGPLTEENGFYSQGDVSIDTRKAADLLGATPMDRPEDIEVNPVTGRVYIMLTKNPQRTPEQQDGPNPRAQNFGGQIVELVTSDHTADSFHWDLFLVAGDPSKDVTAYHPDTSEGSWLAAPDNCTFDRFGNIWVTSDGAEEYGTADGVWMIPTTGELRAKPTRFLRAPKGAEVCGPFFTPDNRTLFCAIQHPGNDSSFDDPDTRWPDFTPNMPPRPALVAITRKDGKAII